MADEQVSFTSLVLIVVLGGLVIRYLFFPSSTAPPGAPQGRDAAAGIRAREAAVERIQQMFPQMDRRTILWELQRNRGNMAMTTERMLTGRAETVSSEGPLFSLSLQVLSMEPRRTVLGRLGYVTLHCSRSVTSVT